MGTDCSYGLSESLYLCLRLTRHEVGDGYLGGLSVVVHVVYMQPRCSWLRNNQGLTKEKSHTAERNVRKDLCAQ